MNPPGPRRRGPGGTAFGTGREGGGRSLKARAVGWLARREYTHAELRTRLLAAGADGPAADALVAELAALGYLSDARAAESLVRQKREGHGRRAIAAALRERGVPADDAAAALAALPPDDEATLAAVWTRRFGRPPQDEREKARQVRFLMARGFALAAIVRLLKRVGAAPSPDDPSDDA